MKLPILILAAAIPAAHAATLAVLPGESIQAKIDAAAPGDIIAIFGGTYSADVTINKAVRLVEVDGQDVTLTGNVTWNGVTNAPPFEGFTVGSSGKGITVTNTTGLVIKNVSANTGSGLTSVGNSAVSVIGGQFASVSQGGGTLTILDATVSGAFNATVGSQKTVAVRCVFSTGDWNTLRGYLGYCYNLLTFKYSGSNGKIAVIGCRLERQSHNTDAIKIQGGGTM